MVEENSPDIQIEKHSEFKKEKYDGKHIDDENEKNLCKARHLKKLTVLIKLRMNKLLELRMKLLRTVGNR